MVKIDQRTMGRAQLAMQEAVSGWIYDPNVMLIDFGWPEHGGQLAKDELAIRVHVIEKFSQGLQLETAIDRGTTRGEIPDEIAGFPVDKPQGVYGLHQWFGSSWRRSDNQRARRTSPMQGGISISNAFQYAFGTLGGLVADRATGDMMILSNWHVLVGDWRVRPGGPIYQPGRGDGGRRADTVATYSRDAMASNLDAAVAKLTGSRALINDQLELAPVRGVGGVQLGMEVIKSGRRTRVTRGLVTAVFGTIKMNYRGVLRLIRNVITIEPRTFGQVSAGGDSGSFWLQEKTMNAIGLHFAGSDHPERALAIAMQPVLDALSVDLVI